MGTAGQGSQGPRITRITIHPYTWESRDLGRDYNGFNLVYEPGAGARPRGTS